MNEIEAVSQLELGQYLTLIRERAGMKQAELARKITWSPALLSRVETGDRQLAQDELQILLNAIGTPEAEQLNDIIQRDWEILPRPSLDHPEQNLLWEAEQVAKRLNDLGKDPDIKNAFERRLSEYIEEIKEISELLLKREYQIAFIGSIGIGKSTAICRLTGLEVKSRDGEQFQPVLETGGGGITICEVHLRTGPAYGLIVESRTDDEIRANVSDFSDYLLQGQQPLEGQSALNESQGVSKEVGRAIWNMAGFKIRRDKDEAGKVQRTDEAKELAKQITDHRELSMNILARMELHKRDRRDIWYDSSTGVLPLVWIKDVFEAINNGRHSEFSIPKRIEILIPDKLLGLSEVEIEIIDTKGIDKTATRADLEYHFYQPHTITILCSAFNNAPSAEARTLLERASEAGVRSLTSHSSLLVLPRPEEALAVRDEAGMAVETSTEGYELKSDQVSMSLQPIQLQNLSIGFFNSREDSPENLRVFLSDRINTVKKTFQTRMQDTIRSAQILLENYQTEQTQEVIKDAANMLKSWIGNNNNPKIKHAYLTKSLIDQIRVSHHNTIRASINRRGEWDNLSYSHHLGYGARRVAVISLQNSINGFTELCKTMSTNPDYEDALDFINQSERVLSSAYEDLLRESQLRGKEVFRDALRRDTDFWLLCGGEYGQGYRDRIVEHNENWFQDDNRTELEEKFSTWLTTQWNHILHRLTSILG